MREYVLGCLFAGHSSLREPCVNLVLFKHILRIYTHDRGLSKSQGGVIWDVIQPMINVGMV